uniref:Antiluteolysin n=1 Tax=Capra hircus TaxID=9925 RepID=A0A452EMN1_CAPHI
MALDPWANLRLLGQMRRLSPRFCLQDRKDFGGQLQEAQALSVLHEMLQQSFNLFHPERSSAAWDTTLLEQLRTGIHQQLEDLDACLGQVMGEEDSALGRTGPTLAVKRYFQGIQKEYSDCAWEILRVEMMESPLVINQLARKVKKDGWRSELTLKGTLTH